MSNRTNKLNRLTRATALAITAALVAMTPLAARAAEPGSDSDRQREKAKLVSRIYAVAYGYAERCARSDPEVASEYAAAASRFIEKNAYLVKLVLASEYHERARQVFSDSANGAPPSGSPGAWSNECRHVSSMLRAFSDTAEGQASVREFEAVLSK